MVGDQPPAVRNHWFQVALSGPYLSCTQAMRETRVSNSAGGMTAQTHTHEEIPFERLELVPWARRRVEEHRSD